MTTKLIGMKEFRQNMAKYTKKARKEKIRFVILRKNVPVLEVKTIDEKEFALERLKEEIAEAEEDIKHGRVYTEKEMMKKFGLL